MNIYDAAHNLARALNNSNEYQEYLKNQQRVFSNPNTKRMIADFRKKVMEVQMEQMSGQRVDERKVDEVKKLEETLMSNTAIKDYFMSEMRFSQTMNDIYKIIGESIDIDLGFDNQ